MFNKNNYLSLLIFIILFVHTTLSYPKTNCGSGASHNLILGVEQSEQSLFYTADERMPASLQSKQMKDIRWPPKNKINYSRITQVLVLDQKTDGTGGCAYLTGGGIGVNFIKLHLESQDSQPYDFKIYIYGK